MCESGLIWAKYTWVKSFRLYFISLPTFLAIKIYRQDKLPYFLFKKNLGGGWLLSPLASEHAYNLEPEGLTRNTQLPAVTDMKLCRKLQIVHQRGWLIAGLEDWLCYT